MLKGGTLGTVFLLCGIASGLGHCEDPDTSWTRTESALFFGGIGVVILAWTLFGWLKHEKEAARAVAALHDDVPHPDVPQLPATAMDPSLAVPAPGVPASIAQEPVNVD